MHLSLSGFYMKFGRFDEELLLMCYRLGDIIGSFLDISEVILILPDIDVVSFWKVDKPKPKLK